jgi:CheY-like chemotaxis protein
MTRILLIEDSSDIRENTLEILELAGYEVIAAVNGLDGIEKVNEHKPHVVLCDMQMPEMNGRDVFQNLKANPSSASIPFVFVTASAEKREIESALAMGADGYVCKPFEVSELLDAINRSLKKIADS